MSSTQSLPQKKYLALGDSYTIGESVDAKERYPVQAVAKLREKNIIFSEPQIIATTGWTTADLISAINKTKFTSGYDIVTLLIGVNNQYQGRSTSEYEKEFDDLVKKSIMLAGNRANHVIVLSVPDYSITPFARNSDTASIALGIDAFNIINKRITLEHHAHYLDITGESRKALHDPSLIAEDGLHFSGKAYKVWAEKLLEIIEKVTQK